MARFVQRITVVSADGGASRTVFKEERKKRKVSRWLKPRERADRKVALAMKAFSDEWLRRHDRSNRKRRNGWMRDGGLNLMRANRKAWKKLRKF